MPIIDPDKTRKNFERLHELGIRDEDVRDYHARLPVEGRNAAAEDEAFAELIAGKNFSEEVRVFIKEMLDACDPR